MYRTQLTAAFLLFQALVAAQSTPELDAVNALFSGTVVVRLDRQERLVFDLFDATGRFRQDVVPAEQLDASSIHYSKEEDAVILECKSAHAQCITKEIFKMNTVRFTGRSNLPRPHGDVGALATMDAMKTLILNLQQRLAAEGETKDRSPRKN